jgi:hemoglobin/transferrin/lactoferrin receptor protein
MTSFCQILTVKDIHTLQPLEAVTLISDNPRVTATTDKQGQVEVSAFQSLSKITISSLGYLSLVKSYEELRGQGATIWLSPAPLNLSEVVVSATRWKQPAGEAPFRITAVGAKEIAFQNPQTTADLLGMTGEVFIQKSQQGGGSPMIRGFATNRLLIAVDGVRMNTAIFRSGNLQNVISLDPFSLEKAEVLFGPGSVIYGSDAIAGVMHFKTLSPKLSAEASSFVTGGAALRYSSANQELTAHFNMNTAWKKFALTTSFTHSDFGDLRMGSNGPNEYLRTEYVSRQDNKDVLVMNEDPLVQTPTGYQQINLMQKVRYQPDTHWNFVYGFHYSTTTDFARYDRLLRYQQGLPRSAEWRYGPQEWIMNNLTATHSKPGSFYEEMAIRLTHQFFEESRIDRDFNDLIRRTRLEKVNAWSLNVDLRKAIGTQHKFFYGIEGVYDDVNATGVDENTETHVVAEGPARYPQSKWLSYAAYAAWQYKATKQLIVHTGARYNHFKLDATFDTRFYPFPFTAARQNNGALTSYAGLALQPSSDFQLRANFSTGFRAPNVDDMGKVFDSEPGFVVVPNPALGAEYALNYELGLAKSIGSWAQFDLAGFFTQLKNALVRRDFTLNGLDSILYNGELSRVQAVQNAAFAKVWGIHTALTFQLADGCTLSSQLTWQKGEEELDNGETAPLRHAAPWFGLSRLSYAAKGLRLEAYLAYSGEVSFENLAEEERRKNYIYAADAKGNPYAPGWVTLNFKASCQLSDLWTITGGVENITDRRYRPYSSGMVAAGRNFVLSLRASF